jgi:hypothetical protein
MDDLHIFDWENTALQLVRGCRIHVRCSRKHGVPFSTAGTLKAGWYLASPRHAA